MRDALLWGTAVIFLLTALYTVAVRREVYRLAADNGELHRVRDEQRRIRDNFLIDRERLQSPVELRRRAIEFGILPSPIEDDVAQPEAEIAHEGESRR